MALCIAPRSRTSGFTLIEVLIALVVFGFVALILNQGMRFGIAAWARQARLVSERSDLDGVDRAIRGLVAQMDPGGQLDNSTKITGDAHVVQFTSRLPDGAAGLPTRTADVGIGVDAAGRLVVRVAPHYRAPLGPPRAAATSVLADGVDRLDLSYWRAAGKDGPAGWVRAWSDVAPPSLLRLHIVFRQPARRAWPDIVAQTMRVRV